MRRGFVFSLIAFALLCTAVASAERAPVKLERANTFRSFDENGKQRQELQGNVWITKDSLSVYCDRAIYYPDSGILIFRSNVEFRQPGKTLFADEVIYDEFSEEVTATGRARMYQDSLRIAANHIVYRERFKTAYLYDDVRIDDDSRNIMLTGDRGCFDHELEYAWVSGSPSMTQRDSSLAVQMRIYGDTLEYSGVDKLARSKGNVIIMRDSLLAYGTQLTFHSDSSFAELIGEPYAVQSLNEITGDTLRLYYVDDQLDHLEVLGHAVATSPADSIRPEPKNRMEGKRMSLWIVDNALSKVVVRGNAIATYYIREQNDPRGRNVTSGDVLYVFFAESRISHIEVDGGTQGQYTPEKLVQREADKENR
jgi:lipopolysaccharide export system protein LptA